MKVFILHTALKELQMHYLILFETARPGGDSCRRAKESEALDAVDPNPPP